MTDALKTAWHFFRTAFSTTNSNLVLLQEQIPWLGVKIRVYTVKYCLDLRVPAVQKLDLT